MILNEVHFMSEVLTMRSTMYVLLPQRTLADTKGKRAPKYRTLYLLHGHSDDHTAWQRWTSIERYAEAYNLAVVMPAANLSFYTDTARSISNTSVKRSRRWCGIYSRSRRSAKIILWRVSPWADTAPSNWH
jgi:hypothetical protein